MLQFCSRHGEFCAKNPFKVILVTIILAGLAFLGLFNFHTEANAIKLWIPDSSDFARFYRVDHIQNRIYSKAIEGCHVTVSPLQPNLYNHLEKRSKQKIV